MRFDDPWVLFGLIPSLLAVYFAVLATGGLAKRLRGRTPSIAALVLLAAGLLLVSRQPMPWLVAGAAAGTLAISMAIGRLKMRSPRTARLLAGLAVAGNLAVFLAVRWQTGPSLEPLAAGITTFLGVALVLDVFRNVAAVDQPLAAAVALVPLPLLVAGPVVRYREFRTQLPRPVVGMGPFTYGVRRFVTGLLKVLLVAVVLDEPVDAIFNQSPARLTMDAAWLGAMAFSLQLYFQLSGWADMAIGLGRMLGFRFPENFRRPYTADSVRDFWRRWNITLMTGLRDYVNLPIAGRDNPTIGLFANLVLAFSLMGLWHGWGWTVVLWGVYAGLWLALEETGLGARIARLPRVARHAYVLLVVGVGWVLLRAESVPAALTYLATMAGLNWASGVTAHLYLTPASWLALAVALVGAGPLIPSISRWRVSVDAATVSVMLMVGATGIFVWRGVAALRPSRVRR